MKSKVLLKLFSADLALPDTEMLQEGEITATLFGTEEVKVDAKRGAIRFPALGWVPCGMSSQVPAFDWVAMVKDGDEWNVVLGTGNPYNPAAAGLLPSKKGRILAVPYAAISNMPQNVFVRRIGEA